MAVRCKKLPILAHLIIYEHRRAIDKEIYKDSQPDSYIQQNGDQFGIKKGYNLRGESRYKQVDHRAHGGGNSDDEIRQEEIRAAQPDATLKSASEFFTGDDNSRDGVQKKCREDKGE